MEQVQERAVKLVNVPGDSSDEEKLRELGLFSLEEAEGRSLLLSTTTRKENVLSSP